MERPDTYEERRKHLAALSDDQLKDYFWELIGRMMEPIVEEARTHTSPSIERSVLLRMGFSSVEAKALVTMITERGLLGHGAGNIVMKVAGKRGRRGGQHQKKRNPCRTISQWNAPFGRKTDSRLRRPDLCYRQCAKTRLNDRHYR